VSQTAVIALQAGTVATVVKVNGRWKVTVASPGGGVTYTDLDTVVVASCQRVDIGDTIGYRNEQQTTINLGVQAYDYVGNGTNLHTDVRLKGATNVKWARAGILKKSGMVNDSFTHDPIAGTIQSTENQEILEWFHVFYIPGSA
jgi:hypothetical protein